MSHLLTRKQMLNFFPLPAQGKSFGTAQTSARDSSKLPYQRNCDYPLWETLTHLQGPNMPLTFSCSCYSHSHESKTLNTAIG